MTADHAFVDAPPLAPRGPIPTVADAKRRARVHVRSLDAEGTVLYVGARSGRTKLRVDLSDTRSRYVLTRAEDCVVLDGAS